MELLFIVRPLFMDFLLSISFTLQKQLIHTKLSVRPFIRKIGQSQDIVIHKKTQRTADWRLRLSYTSCINTEPPDTLRRHSMFTLSPTLLLPKYSDMGYVIRSELESS